MRRQRFRRASRGVTLIEVLIVVAILSLIAAGVAVAVVPMYGDASIKITRTDAASIRGLATGWTMAHPGECPSFERLVKDRVVDSAARGVDAWKNPFRIRCEQQEIVVSSAGPDGKHDTDDDIVVPAP